MKCPDCQADNLDTARFCSNCAAPLHPSDEIAASPTKTLETSKEEITTGSTFADRYQVIEELGKGGMGKVYKVLDKDVDEKVALKLIKPEIAADEKTIKRFGNELKFARKISHKNVCRMYDLGKYEGTHFITMEYVSGEDLKSFIRRSRQLNIGTAIVLAKQVCEGLAEAHRLGVVHRDLKPQNVMIDKEGNAKIMDFGIARSLKAKGITGAGVMIGTPEYMSPEQVEGKEADQRSDIYSLGVILYEMVTGQVPFEGDTPLSIAVKHKTEAPQEPKEINAQIPDDLSLVILKCLEKNKENRYQEADEVHSELSRIEKGIPTKERVVPKRKPITSREITVQFSLKKLRIPALGVVAVAIIGIIIWQLLPQKEVVLAQKIENSIAVISFENQTGDNAYDHLQKVIPNLLITNLENSGYFYVVTWERMHDLLKQIGKGDRETIDRDLGFELCLREGIEAIVLGSFAKAGDMFATDAKVLNVETKRLIKSSSSKGEGVDSILKTHIDELSRDISQGMGISKPKIDAAPLRISDVTTTSMEAYSYFLRGKEADEKFYFDEARRFLEKAVELDPTFASAYLRLAWVYEFLESTKERNEAFEKAKIFSEKVTEKEKLYIDADYARRIERDEEKRLRILEQLVKKYPKEKLAHYYLGRYYQGTDDHKAIEEYNKALELDPDYAYVLNQIAYTYAFGEVEDYEKAIEYLERYAALSPGEPNPFDSMGEVYFLMGKLDEAMAKYKEAVKIKTDFFSSYWNIGYIYALKEDYVEAMNWKDQFIGVAPSAGIKAQGHMTKGYYHFWLGSFKQSLRELDRADDLFIELKDEFAKAFVDLMKGWIYYHQGDLEQSKRHFETWFDFWTKNRPEYVSRWRAYRSFFLGMLNLKQKQFSSVESNLEDMKSQIPKLSSFQKDLITYYYNILYGEMLLVEGPVEKVLSVCEKASPWRSPPALQNTMAMLFYNTPLPRDIVGRAHKIMKNIDQAIAKYEQLITFDPSSKNRRLIYPKYYYSLAKLYEQKGWKGKAMEHYQKFLDLWKDADPGIAEVEDAQKRLASLQSQP